jgi:hypothetical protein
MRKEEKGIMRHDIQENKGNSEAERNHEEERKILAGKDSIGTCAIKN